MVIRKRPLTKRELKKKCSEIVDVISPCQLTIAETKTKVDMTKFLEKHKFTFDNVFDKQHDNQLIYS